MIDFTKKGKCSRCSNCCSMDLPLTEKEVEFLKVKIKPLLPKIKENLENNKKVNLKCPFLLPNKKCKIYLERPSICKIFICNEKAFKKMAFSNMQDTMLERNNHFIDVLPDDLKFLAIKYINQMRINEQNIKLI